MAMAHQRKLIRQAVAALLVSANTAAGSRVRTTRVDPLKATELPAISVYTLSEPVDEASAETAPRELTRKLQLEVTGFVAHTTAVSADDAMDNLAEQIEAAMDADRWLGGLPSGLAADSILSETEMQVVEGGTSDPLIGVVTLTYTVTYRTSPAPAATPDDFTTADVKQQLAGGVSDTPVAEDTFTVQET